jgi:DnaK suppressor protein
MANHAYAFATPSLNSIDNSRYSDKLRKRREQIDLTLDYLKNERRTVEENIHFMDRAAFQSRMNLFALLTESFYGEIEEIQHAFDRLRNGTYGLCVRCHGAVEFEQLELCPATQFCFDCLEFGEL